MSHSFVFDSETEQDHVFRCTVCGRLVGFNKPGIGEPNASESGGAWIPPADIENYVTPCTGVE